MKSVLKGSDQSIHPVLRTTGNELFFGVLSILLLLVERVVVL